MCNATNTKFPQIGAPVLKYFTRTCKRLCKYEHYIVEVRTYHKQNVGRALNQHLRDLIPHENYIRSSYTDPFGTNVMHMYTFQYIALNRN